MSETIPASAATSKRRPPRTATVLRWVHLLSGMLISVYFLFMPEDGWSDTVNTVMGQGVVAFVAWTGIIRWQLPRYRRWRARRRASSPSAV
ncbi:MAG: hypothetical protein EA340_14270 [Nitriliruptor sp.]|nr:MAG: hypothetical protein EA340_14270 [Nitriliruptor sp.]